MDMADQPAFGRCRSRPLIREANFYTIPQSYFPEIITSPFLKNNWVFNLFDKLTAMPLFISVHCVSFYFSFGTHTNKIWFTKRSQKDKEMVMVKTARTNRIPMKFYVTLFLSVNVTNKFLGFFYNYTFRLYQCDSTIVQIVRHV